MRWIVITNCLLHYNLLVQKTFVLRLWIKNVLQFLKLFKKEVDIRWAFWVLEVKFYRYCREMHFWAYITSRPIIQEMCNETLPVGAEFFKDNWCWTLHARIETWVLFYQPHLIRLLLKRNARILDVDIIKLLTKDVSLSSVGKFL